MGKLSRGVAFILAAMMVVGVFGSFGSPTTANAESAKECLAERPNATGRDCVDAETFFAPIMNGEADGFVTISDETVGIEGAFFCSGGISVFGVMSDLTGAPGMLYLEPRPGMEIPCDEASFARGFPGTVLVVNSDKSDGWVVEENAVSMCMYGYLLEAWPIGNGHGDGNVEPSLECPQAPSQKGA